MMMRRWFAFLLSLSLALPAWADCEKTILAGPCRGRGCIDTQMNTTQPRTLPNLPGTLINDGERFILDQGTWADIDTSLSLSKGLLDPVLAEIPSQLGKARLQWEMERPLLRTELIVARQQAVRELMKDNGKLMANLSRMFKKHQSDAVFTDEAGNPRTVDLHLNPAEALGRLEDPAFWRGVGGDAHVLLQNLAMATVGAYIYLGEPGVALLGSIAVGGMLYGRLSHEQRGFSEARHLVQIFERTNGRLVRSLKKMESPVLKQIAHDLEVASDVSRPDSLVGARRFMRRAMILENSIFLTNYIAKVRATKKLNERLDSIVSYLDALAELEMLVGIAHYQLKHLDTHRFLTMKDPSAAVVRIEDAHNPNILRLQEETGKESRPTHFYFSPENRVELVTGANAEGKTTALRTEIQIGLASQIGYPVPARGETIPMIFIAGNKVPDTVGKSLMMVQCERIAHMLNAAIALLKQGHRVMLKFDEPFDGTSPEERRALVAAIIIYVGQQPNLYASIATHERSLIDLVSGVGNVTTPAQANSTPISPDFSQALSTVRNVHYQGYAKQEGGAKTRNALKIAAQMGMPSEVLAIARRILKDSGIDSD
ncbi:MAG: hypothetical protein AB7F86_08535 [Bdellovibrionales bacterium]